MSDRSKMWSDEEITIAIRIILYENMLDKSMQELKNRSAREIKRKVRELRDNIESRV